MVAIADRKQSVQQWDKGTKDWANLLSVARAEQKQVKECVLGQSNKS